jgi:hypothetical protein
MENQDEKKPKPPKGGPYTIFGPTTFAALETYTYNVLPADGVEYEWIITGGNIMSGEGTDTIVVQWTGTLGTLTVNVISGIAILDTSLGGHLGD